MTGIRAPGVGSGLDISSLVSQLVAAERAPLDARITRQQSSVTTEISGLAGLKSAASTLRDALSGLRTLSSFAVRSATSSNKDVFTASATSDVLPGTYSVEVENIATAHKLASTPFVDGRNAVVGTGTLTVTYGTNSFTVDVDSTHNTLTQIRDAINADSENGGVSASIVNEVGGSRLLLTARTTGVASAITITQTGGDGGLAALVYDPAAPQANTMTATPAVDALIRINGYEHSSASNSVSGVIDGLTLTLTKAEPGTEHTLTIADDTAAASARIKKFVADYNALAKTFSALQAYNPTTRTGGALLGDAFVRGLEQQVRNDLSTPVEGASGAYTSLSALGITSDAKGQLVVNDAKLSKALSTDFNGVAAIFGAEGGVAARMYTRLEAVLESDAQIAQRTETLNKKIKALAKEQEVVDTRMAAVEARYRAQFTTLDNLLTQMTTTGNFLAQQMAAWNK
jgi:flagellar hook-associated protein 2